MFKKEEYEESRWFRGLKEAEEFMKVGWYYDPEESTSNHISFRHPEGGRHGWCGMDWEFNRGMMDYVEHRKLNGEIYESI